MGRLLLAFGAFEGAAVAAFLWAPVPPEGRGPGDLLGWALAASGCFYLLLWPLLDGKNDSADPKAEAVAVAARGGLLLLALAPFLSAALALAPLPAKDAFRTLAPAVLAWAAGGALAWSARVGGPALGRAAAAAALAALALGPVGRMLIGAAGSLPGPAFTLSARPWLIGLAALFPAAALLARRLNAGETAK